MQNEMKKMKFHFKCRIDNFHFIEIVLWWILMKKNRKELFLHFISVVVEYLIGKKLTWIQFTACYLLDFVRCEWENPFDRSIKVFLPLNNNLLNTFILKWPFKSFFFHTKCISSNGDDAKHIEIVNFIFEIFLPIHFRKMEQMVVLSNIIHSDCIDSINAQSVTWFIHGISRNKSLPAYWHIVSEH